MREARDDLVEMLAKASWNSRFEVKWDDYLTPDDKRRKEAHDAERSLVRAILTALSSAGLAVVPVEPTREMLNAAIDVDSLKLGYIAPLGFRCSPQQLFDKCYRAMIAAALPPLASGGG